MLNDAPHASAHRRKFSMSRNITFFAKMSVIVALSFAALSALANYSFINCVNEREKYYKRGVYRLVPDRAITSAYYYCRKNT